MSVAFLSSAVAVASVMYVLRPRFAPGSQVNRVDLSLEGMGLYMLEDRTRQGFSRVYDAAIKQRLRLTSAPMDQIAAAFSAGLSEGYGGQDSEDGFDSENPLLQLTHEKAIHMGKTFTIMEEAPGMMDPSRLSIDDTTKLAASALCGFDRFYH